MNVVILLILSSHKMTHAFDSFAFKRLSGCEKDFIFQDGTDTSLESRSKLDCARSCSLHRHCLGFNFCQAGQVTGSSSPLPHNCQLVSQWSDSCDLLTPARGCSYGRKGTPCIYGDMNKQTRRCDCQFGYAGTACERHIRDCTEGNALGLVGIHDNILIQPLGAPAPFLTRCDFNFSVTMVIRREPFCADSDVFMQGSWEEVQGHTGDCGSCCFIGLDNLHYLLNQGDSSYTLSVYVRANNTNSNYKIYYQNARMLNDSGHYAMTWGNLGKSIFSIDDGFVPGGNRKFCAPDHDCSGCAASAGHAGWFDDSRAGCPEAKGLGQPLQWPISGKMQNLQFIYFEVMRP